MKLPKITINRYYVLFSALFIYLIYPASFACRYFDYLRGDEILDSLVRKTTHNLSEYQHKGIQCDYTELIEDNLLFYKPPYTSETLNKVVIKSGGEYTPEDCSPSFSTAIIVPYRDRESQLKQFLIYMHNYLRRQQIHYRIFIIEQDDSKPFNRAKLFNIGASIAMKLDYPCLVLQDVDLMPMRLGNIYACSKRPRHMSSSLDLFRYNLPYYGLFGGAVAISSETFLNVNGFSNMFQGWGGEDDVSYLFISYLILKLHYFFILGSLLSYASL